MLRSAVVLDAGMSLQGARTRLFAHPEDAQVVVRSQAGLELTFHLFTAGALLDRIRRLPATAEQPRLGDALHLRLLPQSQVTQIADLDRARLRTHSGIILDGPAVVGVATDRRSGSGPAAAGSQIAAAPGEPAGPPPPAPPAESGAPLSEPVGPAPGSGAPVRAVGRGPWRFPPGLSRGAGAPPPAAVRERPSLRKQSPAGPSHAATARGGSGEALKPPVPAAGADLQPGAGAGLQPAPWHAWARIELEKDVFVPGETFELGIGLAHEAQADVMGRLIATVLPAGTREVPLDVTIVADGFEAPAGWHYRLVADVTDLSRTFLAIPLVAPRNHVTRLTVLEIHFSFRGVPCGVALRRVAVQPPVREEAGGDPPACGVPWTGPAVSTPLSISPDAVPPDLTITISKPDGNEATGRYCWSFSSPHLLSLPDAPLPMDLGDDARTFAGRVIQLITRAEGTRLIDQALNAVGSMVRDKIPDQLEPILRELWKLVHAATGRPPTVLLHSAEPHVPWELARLENPPDPDAPPFLGAQFAVGRWILGPRGVSMPPAHEVVVQTMAVVAGDYRSSINLRPLPHAEAEGRALEQRWGAVRLAPSVDALDRLLEATLESKGGAAGGAEAIHFACHGEVDPSRPADAMIYLDSDWPLDPSLFLDAPVGRSHGPFLFLNACQVGQTGELLGEYAGFAGSSLRAGFRGVVAPLWSVSDDIAERIALEFYERAWAGGTSGEPVSMILTDMRRRYPAHEAVPPSTWLAYVFYGNPALVLRRAGK